MPEQRQANGFEQVGEPAKRALQNKGLPTIPDHYRNLGELSAQYIYTDEKGAPVVVVDRFDKSDNSDNSPAKEFRPYTVANGKWSAPEVRPLYRLDLLAEDDGPVSNVSKTPQSVDLRLRIDATPAQASLL